MRSRDFTVEDREYFYGRYVALCKEGLKLSVIAERLGLPYSTLRDIVDRTEGKGRFGAKKEEAMAKKQTEGKVERVDIVIGKILEQAGSLLQKHRKELARALAGQDKALSITINGNVVGDEPTHVKTTLAFTLETVKDSEKEEVYVQQMALPTGNGKEGEGVE